MSQTVASSKAAELISRAEQIMADVAYPPDEKLQAIEFLEKVPDARAIEILKRATNDHSAAALNVTDTKIVQVEEELEQPELNGVYREARPAKAVDTRNSSPNPKDFKALKVAERAARALANNDRNEGLNFLKEGLSSTVSNPHTRYVAALGLAGTTSPITFEAFTVGLKDKDEEIVARVVQSLKESLDKLAGAAKHRPDVVKALLQLAALGLLLGRSGNPLENSNATFARFILKQHLCDEVKDWLISQVDAKNDTVRIELAFDLLGEDLTPNNYHRLADTLRKDDCPPVSCRKISRLLKHKNDKYILGVVSSVVREKQGICARLLHSLNLRPWDDDERVEAARVIMNHHKAVR